MKSILIVEDDRIIALNTKSILQKLGYKKVYVANSGVEALEIIEEKHPDLILADIVLDDKISGIELAKRVRTHYKIPVIFVTAHSNEKIIKEAKLSEPYGYITKPFRTDELRVMIEIAFYKSKMERKLQESEKKLKTILHTMPSGLFTVDLNKTIKTWNKEAEIITGLKAKEVIGKPCPEILNSEDCKKRCLLFEDGVNKPIYRKESVIHVNEREIALLKNEDILRDPIGNKIGGIVSFIDITERKRAEDELRRERRFTKNIIATVPDSLLVIDKNLRIKSANHTFYETFQMEPKKVIGASITDILGDEDGRLSRELTKIFGTDDMLEDLELHYPIENFGLSREVRELTSQDDRILNITARAIIFAEEEEEEEELIILRDITERKSSEEELRNAYTELENTQQELIQSQTLAALGGFASGVAHEIRNPLANISASAQYCINAFDLPKKVKNYLRIIIRNSNKANRIIKDLLDFARSRESIFKKRSILQPLNKACELTKAKRLNHNIRLYKRCSRTLPKILMDDKRMEEVFLNIIINSIDSMSKGGRLSIVAYLENEYVIIEISDTGKGIPEQDISKIFNPFFTKKSDGIGLGLSITHRIIQSHKGKIEVESKYNKGTKFTIKLPVSQNENKQFPIRNK